MRKRRRKLNWASGMLVVAALAGTGIWLGLTFAGSGRPSTVAAATAKDPAPIPPPSPPAKPAPKAAPLPGSLEAEVHKAFTDFSGTWAVAVTDLQTGKQWEVGGDERFHPASTIKLPVTLYAMTEKKAGRLHWDDVIQYTEADFESPGGGAFEEAPFGDWYPVENLVNRALMYSNNVAVNMIGRHLGWQAIRDWTKTIGGELYREEDASPSTTALAELAWWRYLYKVSQDDPTTAAVVLDPLRQVAYDGRIGAGLPSGVKYVHKFGSMEPYFHDGGIVWAKRPYALVIMTRDGTEEEADLYISQATAAIHTYMISH